MLGREGGGKKVDCEPQRYGGRAFFFSDGHVGCFVLFLHAQPCYSLFTFTHLSAPAEPSTRRLHTISAIPLAGKRKSPSENLGLLFIYVLTPEVNLLTAVSLPTCLRSIYSSAL